MEIQLIISVVGLVFVILGFYYKINKDTNDKFDKRRIEFYDALNKAVEQGDEKRSRIYERLDETKEEYKKEAEKLRDKTAEEYMQINLCKVIHSNTNENFKRLEGKVNTLCLKIDSLIEEKHG